MKPKISEKKITLWSGIVTVLGFIAQVFEKATNTISIIPFSFIIFIGLTIFSIGGIMFLIQFINSNSLQLDDSLVIYIVKIINTDGDSIVSRKTTFSVNSGSVKLREHSIYSDDDAKMDLVDMNLKVWDNTDKKLFYHITLDKPTQKRFEINFPSDIIEGGFFTYTYMYKWNKLFNVKDDYFILQDSSLDDDFHFILNLKWNLQTINAYEVYVDGTKKYVPISLKGKENIDEEFVV